MVKIFLADYAVFINGEQDQRRGRKLFPGDIISVEEVGEFKIVSEG
jgi:ribosome-associated protein YbcJ (S4-like RNA binding protein)